MNERLLGRNRHSWRILLCAVYVPLLVAVLVPAAQAAERLMLNAQHVPPAAASLTPLGNLPGSQRLNLAIGLPLRNQQELDILLQQLYDPASPNYRRYLTPEEFTAQFGPTEKDYQAVMDFANSNGLTVTLTHPNRVVLDVAGTVADIQKAFCLTLRVYRHPQEAREFYAPDVEPSVDFGVPILHISGLDNYSLSHPNSMLRPAGATADATPNSGSGPGGTYRGSDFRTVYVPGTSLTGAGQTVGLLQFDGFYASDIATYASQAGLPSIPVTIVPIDGGVGTPGDGNSEVCLDIEMVMSMAPGVTNIYVYEAPNPSPWVDLLNAMATHNPLSRQLSCSWGGGSPDATSEQVFKQMAAQGQSFFNATGDSDAFTGSIPFPSDSTNITEVGGTTLTTGTGAAYSSEKVWNWGLDNGNYVGSSGGISTYYKIPSYQHGISMSANKGSTTMRNVPDVALTADNVYVLYNNGSAAVFGGTSCAAPLWAGFTALVNQQAAAAGQAAVGFLNPALYSIGKGASYTTAFHDTTTGNNFWPSSSSKFSGVTGYDLCTGWGTPNGTNLINALAPLPLSLAGTVAYYPTNYPPAGLAPTRVANVAMGLTGATNLSSGTLAGGSYGLSGIAAGGTYCVTPSKTDDSPPANGVDVGDLITIQKQILGIAPLASPYARLAADVNADGSIDVGDLIAIRQLILGITNSLPAGLWRFVPTNYVFLDPQNPWNAPSNHWYTNLVSDVTNGDFVAIKLGDMDNSWTAPLGGQSLLAKRAQGSQALAKSTVPEVVFAVSQQNAQPGQRVTVGMAVSGFSQVCGAQFTLVWDPAVLRYEETGSYGLTGLSAECFGTALAESGKLGFVWYDPTVVGVTLADGSVLFTVSFEVIGKAGSVSAVALAGAPTAQAVSVDFALGAFGAQDGSVTVVGPGALVSNPGYAKGAFRLSVPTEQGRSYILEFTDTLAPADWTALPAVVGDGTVNILVDPAATNQQRFYRVQVQ
jgi:hypothetical protein